jgi:hypothetical protein
MIGHLSSDQLSEAVMGQSDEVAQHVQDCAMCRAMLTNFREALGEFQGAVRAWSEEQADQYRSGAALPAEIPQPHWWRGSHQLAWALLIAAVCIVASFIVPRYQPNNAPASDAVLLNRVDAEVSSTVPASMEPLVQLVVQK